MIIGRLTTPTSTVVKQVLKFTTVGFFTTLINYSIFYVLLTYYQIPYLTSAAIGFITGVLFGFLLNKHWTFTSNHAVYNEMIGYATVYTISLCVGLFLLHWLVSIWLLDPRIANIFVIATTSIANFLGVKCMVFKQ